MKSEAIPFLYNSKLIKPKSIDILNPYFQSINRQNSFMGRKTAKNILLLSATLIFIYIIIFEFILPVNRVLPKPSIYSSLFLIFGASITCLSHLAHTMSIIYFAIPVKLFFQLLFFRPEYSNFLMICWKANIPSGF